MHLKARKFQFTMLPHAFEKYDHQDGVSSNFSRRGKFCQESMIIKNCRCQAPHHPYFAAISCEVQIRGQKSFGLPTTELQPSEQDTRYFPNETEPAILILHLMEYFRHSLRAQARKNEISTTVKLLEETNPKK
jgi:hypothetical protein